MSLLHCACTKARVSDSPAANKPFDRTIYTPLPDDRGAEVSLRSEASSSDSFSSSTAMVEFECDASCYDLYSVIGKGHHDAATIHLAKHIPSNTTIAVKRTALEDMELKLSLIQQEIILCKQLQHEKIIPHYKNFIHGHELWTIMPLMAFGSSRDLIHAFFTTGLQEQAIAYIMRDVLLALEYLHHRGIIHRALKASHILISAQGKVCLSGLQSAIKMVQEGKRLKLVYDYPQATAIKLLQWLSPEVLEQNLSGYDERADIYSVGITACELANGQTPFADMPVTQMLLEKLNGTKPVLADSSTMGNYIPEEEVQGAGARSEESSQLERAFFERTFSQHFHNFVSVCLEKDVNLRPSATQLLSHPFFKNLKRRTSDALPALLHPVTPLTDISKLPKDNSAMSDLAQKLEEVSMIEEWEFD